MIGNGVFCKILGEKLTAGNLENLGTGSALKILANKINSENLNN